ncbi:MAG: cold-shock protein [Polymorphobacter sp.]
MAAGTVKWFNRSKGFGFIRPDLGVRDAFVHVSAVHAAGFEALEEGQRLEFELTQLRDGRLTALGLRPLDDDLADGDEAGANGIADLPVEGSR